MRKTKCNCPSCTKTAMKAGEVYRCKNGAVMGCDNGKPDPVQIIKAITGIYANEKP